MLKALFINVNDSSDSFILPIFKAYVNNFDVSTSAKRVFTKAQNNRINFFENITPYIEWWQDLKDLPTYDEVKITNQVRTYKCENIDKLYCKVSIIPYAQSRVDATGHKGVVMQFKLFYNNDDNIVLINGVNTCYPFPALTYTGYSQYPNYYIFYDDVNEICFASSSNVRVASVLEDGKRGEGYIAVRNSPISKGDIFEYYGYGDATIDNSPSYSHTYTTGDIGKLIEVHVSTAFFEIEKKGTNPTLYEVIKGYIKKYPDGDDDDDFPDGDGDKDSDPVPPDPDFPISVAQTGFVSMYAPSLSQLKQLASFMWSTDFLDLLAKLQQDPYEAIISLKAVKCNFDKGGASNIILGNVDTKISCTEITNQYQQIDCGSINLNRFYGNFLDFNPYTSIKIYLPFIGYRDLDVDEVMGSTLHLYYNIDLLTGSCVALLHVNKKINGTNLDSVLYQYDGIIANEIPVTASNFTQVLSSIIRGAATTAAAIGVTAATGGAGAPASGALLGSAAAGEASTAIGTTMMVNSAIDTVTSKISVQHGGGLSGSMGSLATKQPYVIIQRVIEKNPTNYAKLHGIPSNAYKKLSSLKGFTIMQDIQIQSAIGTVDETEQIKQLLLSGVVF